MMNLDENNRTTSKTIIIPNDGVKWWKRRRIHICCLSFVGHLISYGLRVNLSIAIVAMVNPIIHANGTIIEEAEFNWNMILQGIILSSFYYGYFTTIFIGGWLSSRFGGHLMLVESVAFPAILSIFTPIMAKFSFFGIVMIRVLSGMFCGPISSANVDLWARWAPTPEKTWLLALSYSGSNFGTLITLFTGGFVADRLGWSYLFYIPGVLGVIWSIIWLSFVRKSPEHDKYIDKNEMEYIKDNSECIMNEQKNVKIPWKQIISSGPFWSHILCLISCHWFFYIMLTQLPTYFTDILKLDLTDVGIMSAIPYITMSLGMIISGRLADWCILKGFNPTLIRKLWTGIGFIGQTIFLLIQIVVISNIGIVICLTLAYMFHAIVTTVITVNTLDLSRAHASVLFGISNTFGCIIGIISPTVAGIITQDKEMYEWMILFGFISILSFISTIIYSFYGSGKTQPWADIIS